MRAPIPSTISWPQHRTTRLLRLPVNVGPAGGYAAGLTEFLVLEHDHAWLIDDDCVPAPDALGTQLDRAALDAQQPVVLATMVDHATREITNTQGWCGVLVPRAVVAQVGVPDATLFWWNEDTEYLQWRIPRRVQGREERAGARCREPVAARGQAGLEVLLRSSQPGVLPSPHPATAPVEQQPVRRHLTRQSAVVARRRGRSLASPVRAVVRESDDRGAKVAIVWRGTRDGIAGRLGATVPVDTADRPIVSSTPTA